MKKLISIFAALALVGSLAAQKKKPAAPAAPAKAAAPAVAAPAAPAVAAPVVPAPEVGSKSKGMGLFVDVRGSYTLSNGSSTSAADGATASTANADAVTYKTSASSAIGGGVSIGYDIVKGLGLVASYDIRMFKTREYSGRASDFMDFSSSHASAAGSTIGAAGVAVNHETGAALISGDKTTGTASQKWTNQVIGLGLRPHVEAFGGEIYGGAGLAIVLPFETTQTLTLTQAGTGGALSWNTATDSATKGEIVKGYNIAFGAYGEVGYKFFFTDNIGLNIGIRALVATTDNLDKTKVRTVTNAGTGTTTLPTVTTTTYSDSVSYNDRVGTTTAAAKTEKRPYETLGITDFSATVGLTLKF